MRVMAVSHPVRVWGAQIRLLDYAPHLAGRGLELTLATSAAGPLTDAWLALGLPHLPLELPLHRGVRRSREVGLAAAAGHQARELRAVARSTARITRLARPFDALLSYSLQAHVETALAGRLARRPVVLEVVDLVQPGPGQRLLQLAASMADATIANSAATAATLGPRARNVTVIHPGVDLDRFRPGPPSRALRIALGVPEGVPIVAMVGRVDPRKGVATVLEALGQVRGPAAATHLLVAGDVGIGTDEHVGELQSLARGLLGDRAHFLGRRNDIPELLKASDALVSASVAEPFGRNVLEAQASGLPVIACASGGIPEFVEDGVTGLLVPPADPAALAAALDRLFADEVLAARLAAEGRRQAEARFGLESRWDEVVQVYRRVIGSSQRVRPATARGA